MKNKGNRKATHSGSCQACGSMQKLPEGVLSKHGYTTKWGFFSGICQGSGYLPFEKSKDLIERFIANAESVKAEKVAFLAELVAAPVEPKGWVRIYRTANTRYESSGYHWHLCTFELHQGQYDSRPTVYFLNPDNQRLENAYQKGIYASGVFADDLLGVVAVANARRASAVRQEIAQVDEYIAWQRERIATWKEQDLTEVK